MSSVVLVTLNEGIISLFGVSTMRLTAVICWITSATRWVFWILAANVTDDLERECTGYRPIGR